MDRDVSNNNTSGDDDLGRERTVQLLPEQNEVSQHSLNLATTWYYIYLQVYVSSIYSIKILTLQILTYGGSVRTRSSSLNLLVQNNEADRHGGGSGGGVPVGRARENTYSFV